MESIKKSESNSEINASVNNDIESVPGEVSSPQNRVENSERVSFFKPVSSDTKVITEYSQKELDALAEKVYLYIKERVTKKTLEHTIQFHLDLFEGVFQTAFFKRPSEDIDEILDYVDSDEPYEIIATVEEEIGDSIDRQFNHYFRYKDLENKRKLLSFDQIKAKLKEELELKGKDAYIIAERKKQVELWRYDPDARIELLRRAFQNLKQRQNFEAEKAYIDQKITMTAHSESSYQPLFEIMLVCAIEKADCTMFNEFIEDCSQKTIVNALNAIMSADFKPENEAVSNQLIEAARLRVRVFLFNDRLQPQALSAFSKFGPGYTGKVAVPAIQESKEELQDKEEFNTTSLCTIL